MNKFRWGILFIFAIVTSIHSADLVPQKVGIMLDKNSENYNIDMIIQKAVLSAGNSFSNIILFPGDKKDLEVLGVRELNANLLIRTVLKDSNYVIEFYNAENSPVLNEDSISFNKDSLVQTLDTIAHLIVSILSDKYPPKQKKELKTIEIVKIKLSEFEKLDPAFSIKAIPGILGIDDYSMEGYYQSISNGTYNGSKKLSGNPLSGKVEIQYLFRQYKLFAGFSGSLLSGDSLSSSGISSSIGGGYGFFGSLIILGLELNYMQANFINNNSIIANYGFNGNNYTLKFPVPDMKYQAIWFASFIQLNISKDYYILFKTGMFAPWSSLKLDFRDSQYQVPDGFNFNSSDGPLSMNIDFNFKVINKWHLILDYSMFSRSIYLNEGSSDGNKPVELKKNSGIFLRSLKFDEIRIGLGLEYEI